MKTTQLILCLALLTVVNCLPYSVVSRNNRWGVVSGRRQNAIAWAQWENKMASTGWTELTVETNGEFEDGSQAYGAGYLEGWLAHEEIYNTSLNFRIKDQPLVPEASQFPSQSLTWMRSQVSQNLDSRYWKHIGLVLQQFDGILAGYNARAPADRKWLDTDLMAIQLITELSDINRTKIQAKPDEFDLHCSSLVKLSADGQRLFAAHNSWTSFTWMLRVYKHFKLNFEEPSTVSYSSYPGVIPSIDDFFITGHNMVVMETTNEVFNDTLFQYVTPQTVPYWVRIMLATRLAKEGKEWVDLFSQYNSGTYNNQWIIVDNKKFVPGRGVSPGALWIAEQIPGYIESGDQTETLRTTGYWASYNVAYYPYIYNVSGYLTESLRSNKSDSLSHSKCPRAQIFARDQGKVSTMADMKDIMRYNQYQSDPLSLGDACNGIAARCDLNVAENGKRASPFGAIDAKITEASLAARQISEAVSGPAWTWQPPFAWTKRWNSPHHGQPQVYDFDWQTMTPRLSS